MMSEFRNQQVVEKQLAAAVSRVLLPRLNEEQRGVIVSSYTRLQDAQREHRATMNELVDDLVRRNY